MRIGSKVIGENNPVLIVAELSANHGGSIEIAKRTIQAAKEAGADAIKLQTYTAETITLDCDNEYFQIDNDTIWDGRTLFDLYKEAYTPWEWHKELFDYARSIGIEIFSTPFDRTAVDFLEELKVPVYKVASFEIGDIPLIEYIASKGKPIIMSTGIARLEEIEEAIRTCRKLGNENIVIMKCTSAYPTEPEDANLLNIVTLGQKYGVEVGFSDHTAGIEAPIAATVLGARLIEKHFILDKKIGGPDASFSLDTKQFEAMVKAVRETEKLLGNKDYILTEKQKNSRKFARSLFIVKDVGVGELITEENIRSIRPSDGMSPKYYDEVLGRRFTDNYKRGTPLKWEFID